MTEQQVLNGFNSAWLGPANGQGGELLQFANAALVAPKTYELSTLLRGRLGTEHAVAVHGADEVFVLLESLPWQRPNFGVGDWNRERLFKPVSVFHTLDQTDAQAFTNTGEGKRPLSPVQIIGDREFIGSPPAFGDLTISWKRRSRYLQPGMGYGVLPLAEASESYEVDIVVGGNVVRTLIAATQSVVYNASDQITDGVTPGDPVTVRVYQMSDVRGRGRPGERIV